MTHPFRGFSAILYKEFIVVLRDPFTLFFMFFPPLMEMIAFGYALDNDVKHMATVLLDQDRTVESRRLVEQMVNTETFRVVAEAQSVSEMAALIRQGKARVGIQFSPGFTRELHAGRTARVQVLIDGSSSTVALQALNTAMGVTLRQSLVTLLGQTGRSNIPIEIRPQVLYNPAMRSPNFFVPGVIGVVLQIATTFATAMALVRERERGTLENLLVSPMSRWGLMLGKLVPYLVIGMFMACGLFAIMRWVFDVPIAYFFIPPPGSGLGELADTGRPVSELYASLLGHEWQLKPFDERLAEIHINNPEETDAALAAIFGPEGGARNWHESFRTWRKKRLAEMEREYGDRLNEVAAFLKDFATKIETFGPRGYLESMAHRDGEQTCFSGTRGISRRVERYLVSVVRAS